jgi:hypothetical protein
MLTSPDVPGHVALHAQRLGDGGKHERRVGDRGELYERDPVLEGLQQLCGGGHGQARLADPAGPGHRDETASLASEQAREFGHLLLPPDEGDRLEGQTAAAERAQRREVVAADLEEPNRRRDVLQAVLSQVAQLERVVEECLCRVREDDLAAVTGRRDARGPVDVEADVVVIRDARLPGVDADPHTHRPAYQRALSVRGRRDRVGGAGEGGEDGVALGPELDAAVTGERVAKRLAVLAEELCIALAHLFEQPRRPLDVGEEQRDRAGGEPAHCLANRCVARTSSSSIPPPMP